MQGEGDAPPVAQQLAAAANCSGSDSQQALFPDLHNRSLQFLENIKTQLGPDSKASVNIHNALGEFAARRSSKRETYYAIIDELGCHSDLEQELYAILDHVDARWSPRDFHGEPPTPVPVHSPAQFLQPQYQPENPVLRLPNFWESNSYTHLPQLPYLPQLPQPSINPELIYNPFASPHMVSPDKCTLETNPSVPRTPPAGPSGEPPIGSRLRLPSFDALGIANSHPDQIPSFPPNPFNNPTLSYSAGSVPHPDPLHALHPDLARSQEPFVGFTDSSPRQVDHEADHIQNHGSPEQFHDHDHGVYAPDYPDSTLSGHPQLRSFARNAPSSPAAQLLPHPFPGFGQHTSSGLSHTQGPSPFLPYTDFRHGMEPISPDRGLVGQPHRSFSFNEAWDRAQYERATTYPTTEESYSPCKTGSPDRTNFEREPETPRAHLEHQSPPTFVMHPPRKRIKSDIDHTREESEEDDVSPTQTTQLPLKAKSTQAATTVGRPQAEFIHALCGKAFTRLRSVKKHHWGPKMDDVEAVAGCWAKHGKPNVAWDDHPSCKDHKVKTTTTKRQRPRVTAIEPKPSMADSLKPGRRNTVVDIPTLENLPNMVVESLTPTTPPLPLQGDMASQYQHTQDNYSHQENFTPQFPHQGAILSYHTSQLPSQRTHSMESLLTVVNAASSMDAPSLSLQDRTDSVVSHLHAQNRYHSIGHQAHHTSAGKDESYAWNNKASYDTLRDNTLRSAVGLSITGNEEGTDSLMRAPALLDQNSKNEVEPNEPKSKPNQSVNDVEDARTNDALAYREDGNKSIATRNSRKRGSRGVSKHELRGLGLHATPAPRLRRGASRA